MKQKLIHQGRLISFYEDQFILPNGKEANYEIVRHPGGAVIAAIDDSEKICLLRQYRYVLDDFIWEFPAGCIEMNEQPLVSARRELQEEAGVTAKNWTELGQVWPSPGFCNEVLHLFLASELYFSKQRLDDEEILETHWFTLHEIEKMIAQNEIIDAKTIALTTKLRYMY